jgi:hypothetical protein
MSQHPQNPLTDPTSLIAYRLAHAESSRPAHRATGKPGGRSGAAAALGLFLLAICTAIVVALLI